MLQRQTVAMTHWRRQMMTAIVAFSWVKPAWRTTTTMLPASLMSLYQCQTLYGRSKQLRVLMDIQLPKMGQSGQLWHRRSLLVAFSVRPGPTAYAHTVTRPVDAFRLLIDEGMLRHIKRCPVEYAQSQPGIWLMLNWILFWGFCTYVE